MRLAPLLVVFTLIHFIGATQDSVSVLFIGNSYTYYNNLPQMVKDVANSKGDNIYFEMRAPGGATFQNHASNSITYDYINSKPWDFVILQAQSQEPSFPDAQVNTNTLPYAMQLADSVYANNFCSEVQYFLTWGRENGDPQWQPISTYDGMQARLRSAYLRFADSTQGSVAPVGAVWKYVRDNHPQIVLYSPDESHPSVEGTYLAACTFYTSLFRKSPVGSTFYSSIDPGNAQLIQQAVATTLMDSLTIWNLRAIDEHTQAEFESSVSGVQVQFTNQSTKATNYTWDFGDGSGSIEVDPIHTYATSGQYTVQLIAESPCDSDTISYLIPINVLGILEQSASACKIQRISETILRIDAAHEIRKFQLLGVNGEIIITAEPNHTNFIIDHTGYAPGIYFLVFDSDAGQEFLKIYLN